MAHISHRTSLLMARCLSSSPLLKCLESNCSHLFPVQMSMPQLPSVLQEVIFVSKQAVFAPPKAIRCADT